MHFAWQAQYLVQLESDFSWQPQHSQPDKVGTGRSCAAMGHDWFNTSNTCSAALPNVCCYEPRLVQQSRSDQLGLADRALLWATFGSTLRILAIPPCQTRAAMSHVWCNACNTSGVAPFYTLYMQDRLENSRDIFTFGIFSLRNHFPYDPHISTQ